MPVFSKDHFNDLAQRNALAKEGEIATIDTPHADRFENIIAGFAGDIADNAEALADDGRLSEEADKLAAAGSVALPVAGLWATFPLSILASPLIPHAAMLGADLGREAGAAIHDIYTDTNQDILGPYMEPLVKLETEDVLNKTAQSNNKTTDELLTDIENNPDDYPALIDNMRSQVHQRLGETFTIESREPAYWSPETAFYRGYHSTDAMANMRATYRGLAQGGGFADWKRPLEENDGMNFDTTGYSALADEEVAELKENIQERISTLEKEIKTSGEQSPDNKPKENAPETQTDELSGAAPLAPSRP